MRTQVAPTQVAEQPNAFQMQPSCVQSLQSAATEHRDAVLVWQTPAVLQARPLRHWAETVHFAPGPASSELPELVPVLPPDTVSCSVDTALPPTGSVAVMTRLTGWAAAAAAGATVPKSTPVVGSSTS
jgi:hypothetical protein